MLRVLENTSINNMFSILFDLLILVRIRIKYGVFLSFNTSFLIFIFFCFTFFQSQRIARKVNIRRLLLSSSSASWNSRRFFENSWKKSTSSSCSCDLTNTSKNSVLTHPKQTKWVSKRSKRWSVNFPKSSIFLHSWSTTKSSKARIRLSSKWSRVSKARRQSSTRHSWNRHLPLRIWKKFRNSNSDTRK